MTRSPTVLRGSVASLELLCIYTLHAIRKRIYTIRVHTHRQRVFLPPCVCTCREAAVGMMQNVEYFFRSLIVSPTPSNLHPTPLTPSRPHPYIVLVQEPRPGKQSAHHGALSEWREGPVQA